MHTRGTTAATRLAAGLLLALAGGWPARAGAVPTATPTATQAPCTCWCGGDSTSASSCYAPPPGTCPCDTTPRPTWTGTPTLPISPTSTPTPTINPLDLSPCVAGTVADLLGTTCTIGDLAFTFNSASSDSRWDGVDHPTGADEVWLVPDPSPLNPGFTWSGSFVLNSTPGQFDNLLRFQLVLGVQSLVDSPIVGIGSAVNGVNASFAGEGDAFAQAQNSNWLCSDVCGASATEGYDNIGVYLSTGTASVATDPFFDWCCGLVQFFAVAENGGSVSFDSVSFHFSLVPPLTATATPTTTPPSTPTPTTSTPTCVAGSFCLPSGGGTNQGACDSNGTCVACEPSLVFGGGICATPTPTIAVAPIITGGTAAGSSAVTGHAAREVLCSGTGIVERLTIFDCGYPPMCHFCTMPTPCADQVIGMGPKDANGDFAIPVAPPLAAGRRIYAMDGCTLNSGFPGPAVDITASATRTFTPTATATSTPSPTPSATRTPSTTTAKSIATPTPTPTGTPTNTPTPTLKPAGGGGCAMATTPRPNAAGNSPALFVALALVGLWSVRRLGQGRADSSHKRPIRRNAPVSDVPNTPDVTLEIPDGPSIRASAPETNAASCEPLPTNTPPPPDGYPIQ